jgi:hypothetical protein
MGNRKPTKNDDLLADLCHLGKMRKARRRRRPINVDYDLEQMHREPEQEALGLGSDQALTDVNLLIRA